MKNLIYLSSLILLFVSCNSGTNPIGGDYKPKAISKSNDVVVIADKEIWEGEVGDSLRYYFESPYPITPSPEPLFNLRHFTPRELSAEPLRRELRTYCILADIQDTSSETTKMVRGDYGEKKFNNILREDSISTGAGRNKWAQDQLILYIFGKGQQKLTEAIRTRFNKITNKIHQHDAKQIKANTYASGRQLAIIEKIKNHFLVDLDIPGDYKEALYIPEGNKLLWLRKDTRRATANLILQKFNYSNIDQISVSNAIRLTNSFGKFVNSNTLGSKLVVNDTDLPVLENVKEINGNYTLELRGIWEMDNDFMGGPFVCYLIPDSNTKSYYFILSFIYAPGNSKKQILQEQEVVINSFDLLRK